MYQGARSFCSGPPCLYKEELNRASVYRVIAYFTVTGRHRAQIVYFFRREQWSAKDLAYMYAPMVAAARAV